LCVLRRCSWRCPEFRSGADLLVARPHAGGLPTERIRPFRPLGAATGFWHKDFLSGARRHAREGSFYLGFENLIGAVGRNLLAGVTLAAAICWLTGA